MRKKNLMIVITIIAVLFAVGFYSTGISVAQEKKGPNQNKVHKPKGEMSRYELTPISDQAMLKTGMQKTINIPAAAFVPDGWYYDFYGTYANWWYGAALHSPLGFSSSYLQAPVIFPKGAKKIDKFYVYIDDQSSDLCEVVLWVFNPYYSWYALDIAWIDSVDGYYRWHLLAADGWKISPDDFYFISILPGYYVYFKGAQIVWK